MAPDPMCLRCEEPETIEYLFYACADYSSKVRALTGHALPLALFRHMREYIPSITLTPTGNCV
jgi:hypothetical protein